MAAKGLRRGARQHRGIGDGSHKLIVGLAGLLASATAGVAAAPPASAAPAPAAASAAPTPAAAAPSNQSANAATPTPAAAAPSNQSANAATPTPAAAAPSNQPASGSSSTNPTGHDRPSTPGNQGSAGVMPKHTSPQAAAPAGSHLTYYGGKVISHVQVVQVLYGSGTYTSEVQNSASPSIPTFYAGVTNSTYFDWLSEYNTTGVAPSGGGASSNQAIGRGSFRQQVQIAPAASRNGATIDDSAIQAELSAQIQAGALPMPGADTIFTVYFPANKTITQGGGSSGVTFCAYHGTVAASGTIPEYYYSVLPDFTTGGMTSGCGNGTRFQNETSVSSHELVEAVTDAEVGLATVVARPLAWYDSTNGEIGDICNGVQATVVGGDGVTYTVQKEWSNQQNNCVVSGPSATTNDFSISVNPPTQTVAQGGSATSTLSTAVTAGSAGTVSLSSSGVPSGTSVAISPTSVTAGGSATVTISVGSTTAPGTYALTITGTEGTKTHSTTITLSVSGGGSGGVVNGGFETGTLSGWTSAGSTSIASSGAQSGTYAARVGSTSPTNGDSSLSQTFTAPAGATGLQLAYNVFCPDTVTYDWATATLRDNTTGVASTVLAKTCVNPSSGWKTATSSVTGGHSYTLTLVSHDDNYAGDATYTLYDSVSITSSQAAGIVNGGFETGTLSGWTPAGTASVASAGSHGGTYSATVGSTSPTNGDSTLTQTFSAPAGVTHIGLWFTMTCPDTVTYDWATVTLKDNTTGTTTALLAKTCTTSAWTSIGGAVTAGHSYTLTLLSHDDNYAGDATSTRFDDITLS